MKAFSVGERKGKYYGTKILWGDQVIGRIWDHKRDDIPSQRELDYLSPGMNIAGFWDSCCDSHWECERNYQEAQAIVSRLNMLEKP